MQNTPNPIIIAIASAKGGVGKSTVAVNLACALQMQGLRVGLLDADIYGPSVPLMMGAKTKPESRNDKLVPVICHGVQTMSIGYLLADQDTAMAWRGPMVSRALMQLLQETLWDDLDLLLLDLPPGTGDIQLTLAQKVPVTGAVIVTTPQDVALLDAEKGATLFAKVNIPLLGVITNMAQHVCSSCGHLDAIFGSGGGARFALEHKTEHLGEIPLQRDICVDSDSGTPTVVKSPTSVAGMAYLDSAKRLHEALTRQLQNNPVQSPVIITTV